jgi:cell division protein FtsN
MKTRKIIIWIVLITLSTACSQKEQVVDVDNGQEMQEQFISENLQEEAEEPEFIIEVDYDEVLAQKAAKNKENKLEKAEPITLTADDDDLNKDLDDIPSEVKISSRSVSAYDYESLEVIDFDESKNKAKGIVSKKELFYVVAGAYRTKKDADAKLNTIKKLGYQVELVTFDDNFKTVCIAKLESRKQANILVNNLKKNEIDASVVKRRVEE